MKVRALRGVCIGVERHLAAGDTADLEAAQVQFLVSIGAVERVVDPAPAPAATAANEPAEAGPAEPTDSPTETPAPAKPGKKEKQS